MSRGKKYKKKLIRLNSQERARKLHKEIGQTENNSRMVGINKTISIIMLNKNGLSVLCKRLRFSGWIKNENVKQLHAVYRRIT